MKKILSVLLSLLLVTTTAVPLTGCDTNSTINEINVVLTEATNVLAVAEPDATWVAPLQAAVTDLKKSEASWQAGGPIQDVTNALNSIVAVTADIPLTAKYSPLIDVLVAGIEIIINALPVGTVPGLVAAHAATANNPHLGNATIEHHFMHSRTKEFKDAWNKVATDNGLSNAAIQ